MRKQQLWRWGITKGKRTLCPNLCASGARASTNSQRIAPRPLCISAMNMVWRKKTRELSVMKYCRGRRGGRMHMLINTGNHPACSMQELTCKLHHRVKR